MVSDRIYEACLPILEEEALDEEAKIDKLEDLLSSEPTSLKGKALEDAVLGALWQWKAASDTSQRSPPPARSTPVPRSRSPAPWIQRAATPSSTSGSPRPMSATPYGTPAGSSGIHPSAFFVRTKSSTTAASPFSSPRPSPRLPLATPIIPHSPQLSAYKFSDSPPTTENYGDYGSDTVDWLVNDDASSNASFGDAACNTTSDWMSPYTTEMSPYDMLRSILQDSRSDEELEQILEANGYDLSQTVNALMEAQIGSAAEDGVPLTQQSSPQSTSKQTAATQVQQQTAAARTYLIGKSMSPSSRPATPVGQQKSPVVCRYWLASGNCARADCRFAHEVQNTHLCKYWLAGNCIAGGSCLFSHDPSLLLQQLNTGNTPKMAGQQFPPNFQLSDYESFPALQPTTSNPYEDSDALDPVTLNAVLQAQPHQPPPGLFPTFVPTGPRHGNAVSNNNSRPGSRNSRLSTPSQQPNFQDDEAFPTLGSAASKPSGKRHHGKRGGHGHHNNTHPLPVQQPSSLADVVRMSPSPAPTPTSSKDAMRRGLRNNRSFTSTRENSVAAMAIPAPKDIPWLETGSSVNTAYLKARQEAFKHGGLRNKFLQSAAQAWNRNDARGAKALSLRGQNENAHMREKHREAARALYDERNKAFQGNSGNTTKELYIDLHGLHPDEAVQYLADCLRDHTTSHRPVYAICGTGHHSKNGKDKVGKAIRQHLNDLRYAWREFSVPGDRNHVGGILGIDPASFDRDARKKFDVGGSAAVQGSASSASPNARDNDSGVGGLLDDRMRREDSKVVVVKVDPRKTPAAGKKAAAQGKTSTTASAAMIHDDDDDDDHDDDD